MKKWFKIIKQRRPNDLRSIVFAVVALIIFFFSAGRMLLQFTHLSDYQTSKKAKVFLEGEIPKYFHNCNGGLFAVQQDHHSEKYIFNERMKRVDYTVYITASDLKFHSKALEVTEADRKNGIDAKVVAKFQAMGKHSYSKTLNINKRADLKTAQQVYSFNQWFASQGTFNLDKNHFLVVRKKDGWKVLKHQFEQLRLSEITAFKCSDMPGN